MKYVQILASTLAFVAAAALLVQMRQQQAHLYLFVVLFLLCGANLLSRLTETSLGDQLAEAEEKVAKRVLRRLAKVMPELLNEYFKAQAPKPAEKLSDVVVATREVIREASSTSTPWPCWKDEGEGKQRAVGLCSQCTAPTKCADAKDCALGLIKS